MERAVENYLSELSAHAGALELELADLQVKMADTREELELRRSSQQNVHRCLYVNFFGRDEEIVLCGRGRGDALVAMIIAVSGSRGMLLS